MSSRKLSLQMSSFMLEEVPCERWKIFDQNLETSKASYHYKYKSRDPTFYCRTCDIFFDTKVCIT